MRSKNFFNACLLAVCLKVFSSISASANEFLDQISWIGSDLNSITFDEIIAHPMLRNLLPVDLNAELARYQTDASDGNEAQIERLKSKVSESRLDNVFINASAYTVLTQYKIDHGGYQKLIIGRRAATEYSESYPEYFSQSDERAETCQIRFEKIKLMFGEPSSLRDLSFEEKSFNAMGLSDDALTAEFMGKDFSLQYDCWRILAAKQFSISGNTSNKNNRDYLAKVQRALNFFGFGAGKVDGVFGAKSRSGLGKMQKCLGQDFNNGELFQEELMFLLKSYDFISSLKTLSSCVDLLNLMPFTSFVDISTITVVPKNYAEEIVPITWLSCELKKNRTQLFILGGSEKVKETSEIMIIGLDPKAGNLLGRNGIKFKGNTQFSDTKIHFINTRKLNDEYHDSLLSDWSIDRISGNLKVVSTYSNNGSTTAVNTVTGDCNLLDLATRKF